MTDYPVVLLVEQELSAQDAAQVRSLHEGIEDPVRYHVLLPVDDAAVRVESAVSTLGGGDRPTPGAPVPADPDVHDVQAEVLQGSRAELAATIAAIEAAGGTATGDLLPGDPVDGLAAAVTELGAQEAIVLTASHVVKEFFHVDWASQAQRRLGVPVLHLLERETFDEQAGGGEGVTGL